jgi:hypothetical protein
MARIAVNETDKARIRDAVDILGPFCGVSWRLSSSSTFPHRSIVEGLIQCPAPRDNAVVRH